MLHKGKNMKCYHCKQKIEIKNAKDNLTCPNCQTITYIIQCSQCRRRFSSKKQRSKFICKNCKEKQAQSVAPEPAIEKQPIEKRPVFISYAHEDVKWLNEILKYLNSYKNEGLTVWTDKELSPGDLWNDEIVTAISHANIAILLISIDFINSVFIMEKEVPLILDQFQNNSLRVFPIIVSDCPWDEIKSLKMFHVCLDEGLPLSESNNTPKFLTNIAKEVFEMIQFMPKEESSNSYGPLTYRMCNRIPQVQCFSNEYQVDTMPQFYFIHGKKQDNYQSLVYRYNQTTIRESIIKAYQITEKPYDWEYVFKQYGGMLSDQAQNMLYEFGYELTNDTKHGINTFEDLVNHPMFEPYHRNAIIITHKIEEDFFHKDLLHWYIHDFWINGYTTYVQSHEKAKIPQFVLFFSIIYETNFFHKLTNRKKKIMKYINEIAAKNTKFVLIPELTPVTRQDVESWFNNYTRNLKNNVRYEQKKNEILKQLFPRQKGNCTMDVVEDQLSRFAGLSNNTK